MIGHLEITKELLKHNPDVNSVCVEDNGLETPLMYAAEAGHSHVVEELLMHGADIDFKDANLGTALHLAVQCKNKNIDTVNTLLKYGLEFPDRTIRSRFFRFFLTIRGVGFLALKTEFFGFFGFFSTKVVLFSIKISSKYATLDGRRTFGVYLD